MAALTQLLRDPLSQIAVAIAVLLLVMQGLGVAVFGTELGTSNLPLIPLLVVGILCFELSRRACEPGPERRFWLLLGFSQVMWLLAELVYLLPIPETGEVAVELANDALLAVVYIGVILALQSTPHEEREVSESPHPGPAWQTLGTLLFVAALFLYFSLIPIYFNPDLYVSLVPSTLLFVVLDLYLIAALLLLLRQTSSLRWISVYTAVLIAEIVWVAADTGEGLVYLGVLSSTAPWASLASTVGLLAKIGAARVARASFSETVRPEDASKARLHLAAWDGQLVVFALFLPILHVAFASLGFTDEATRGPREVLVMASILVFGGLAFANHRALEKSNRRLEDRYRDAQKQLVEKQLETVALREHERAEKAILHTQRLESLGVLAGGIAHDFNNLLAAIMGNADLALHKLPGDAPARRYVDEVMAASERATALTGQMLSYAGRGRYDVRRLDLNVVVREIAPLMHSSNSRNARLELEPGLPAIAADAAQLQQLVMNLVTNASDAIGDEPGTITVRTGVALTTARQPSSSPSPTPVAGSARTPARGCSTRSSRRSRRGADSVCRRWTGSYEATRGVSRSRARPEPARPSVSCFPRVPARWTHRSAKPGPSGRRRRRAARSS